MKRFTQQSLLFFSLAFALIISSCVPVKQYYKFRVESFNYSSLAPDTASVSDPLVFKLVSPKDTSELLKTDKRDLEAYAKENDLELSYAEKRIIIEKFAEPGTKQEIPRTEYGKQLDEIQHLRYYGRDVISSYLFRRSLPRLAREEEDRWENTPENPTGLSSGTSDDTNAWKSEKMYLKDRQVRKFRIAAAVITFILLSIVFISFYHLYES